MFARIKESINRNRRKLIVSGIVIGGAYFAYRYAKKRILDFQERQAREFFERSRRLQHFESTENTCNQVIFGMSNELYQMILRECTTEHLLEKLRHNPPNKIEIWEEIKSISFTRLIAFIYASSMLVIAMRVQMNVLGGYLYSDIILDDKQVTDDIKQQYLSLIRYFLLEGVKDLIATLRRKVDIVLKNVSLSQRLNISDIEQFFWSIQIAINSDTQDDPNTHLAKYVMPSTTAREFYGDAINNNPFFDKIYNETLDLLESEDAGNICTSNVSRGFTIAIDNISAVLEAQQQLTANSKINETTSIAAGPSTSMQFNTITSSPFPTVTAGGGGNDYFKGLETSSSSSSQLQNNNKININNINMPLAKIIPIINGITSKTFDPIEKPQNLATSLITLFVISERVKTLGSNVYETFSST